MSEKIHHLKPQHQRQKPGLETQMSPPPQDRMEEYKAADKLKGKIALISGGDSGIGRAVAIGYAKEGADVAIIYLNEDNDADATRKLVEREGRRCLLIKGDIANAAFYEEAVEAVIDEFNQLDILVNNAGEQHPQEDFENITQEQLKRTLIPICLHSFILRAALLST